MELSSPARLLHERPRYFWAQVIRVFIAKGWSPPTPDSRIVEAVAVDVKRAGFEWRGFASRSTLDLTPAEERAIKLAAEGLTVAEAARTAHVGFETMKRQRTLAARKLGARNLPHAVAVALRRGLIA